MSLLPVTEGGFRVVVADPPWSFNDKGSRIAPDRVVLKGGGVGPRVYPTMSVEQIMALPVESVLAPDAAMLLWFPDTHLIPALAVQRAWGFEYKHLYSWVKGRAEDSRIVYRIGMGHWMRKCHETAMLCVRGKPVVLDHGVRSATVEPRGKHSSKPETTQEGLERMFAGPYLELFARRVRPGWIAWGDEVSAPSVSV